MLTAVNAYADAHHLPFVVKDPKEIGAQIKLIADTKSIVGAVEDAVKEADQRQSEGKEYGEFDSSILHQFLRVTFGGGKMSRPSPQLQAGYANAIPWIERFKREGETALSGARLTKNQRHNFLLIINDMLKRQQDALEDMKRSFAQLHDADIPAETKDSLGQIPKELQDAGWK